MIAGFNLVRTCFVLITIVAFLTPLPLLYLGGLILEAQTPERDLKLQPQRQEPKQYPISSETVRELPRSEKRWAVIIGVNQYEDQQIRPLIGAANDATILAEALVKYAGFPEDQVLLIASHRPAEWKPTKGNILEKLSNVLHLVPKDGLFLLAFAGHGIERNGEAYLLPFEARVNENIRVLQATSLSVTEIKEMIKESKMKQVLVLLDACRNDPAAGRSSDVPNPLSEAYRKAFSFDVRNKEVEAFATLYATKIGQRAYEYTEKQHGYFTWAIVEGLKGGAANELGEVTLAALEKYVQEKVPKRISIDLGGGKDQRPFADIYGYKASELVIAKVPRPSTKEAASVEPKSTHDPRLMELEHWERISTSRELTVFQEFRKKYPDGAFSEQALRKMEQLEWESAKNSKDSAALRAFLKKYPNGIYSEQALGEIEKIESKQTSHRAVLEVLKLYEEAYESKDVDKLKTLWPSLIKEEVSRFFKFARSVKLDLRPTADPQFVGDKAVVTCQYVVQFVDERGLQRPPAHNVTIRLSKRGDSWIIESMK